MSYNNFWSWAVLAGLIIVGGYFRIEQMIHLPMDCDESVTYILFGREPLAVAMADYRDANNHLLNTFFMHLSVAAFGNAPWAIRLSACLAGILIIPATFLVGQRIVSHAAALLATGLVAFSYPMIYYSATARGYSMGILFCLLSFYFALKLLERPRLSYWLTSGFCCALAVYSVMSMAYFFGGLLIFLALEGRRLNLPYTKFRFYFYLFAFMLTVSLFLLVLFVPIIRNMGILILLDNPALGRKASSAEFVEIYPLFFPALFLFYHHNLPVAATIILFPCFILGSALGRKITRTSLPWWTSFLAVPFLMLLLQRPVNLLLYERIVLHFLPFYFITAAGGLAWVCERLSRGYGPRWNLAFPLVGICLLAMTGYGSAAAFHEAGAPGNIADISFGLMEKTEGEKFIVGNGAVLNPLKYYFLAHNRPLYFIRSIGATEIWGTSASGAQNTNSKLAFSTNYFVDITENHPWASKPWSERMNLHQGFFTGFQEILANAKIVLRPTLHQRQRDYVIWEYPANWNVAKPASPAPGTK